MTTSDLITCQNCNAQFPIDEMLSGADDESNNTQMHYLVAGRCPKCFTTVEFSHDQLRAMASSSDLDDDD